MSYWVYLTKDDKSVIVNRHTEGGTYAVGGTKNAELNVTYNYSQVYSLVRFSLRDIGGKMAQEVILELKCVITALGTNRHNDYWAPTPGNAGYALSILLKWAKQHPDATFVVS